jgi:hypothetical protein
VDLAAVGIAGDGRGKNPKRSSGAVDLPGEDDGACAYAPYRHTTVNPLSKGLGHVEFQQEFGYHRALTAWNNQAVDTVKALPVTNDGMLYTKAMEMGDVIQKGSL